LKSQQLDHKACLHRKMAGMETSPTAIFLEFASRARGRFRRALSAVEYNRTTLKRRGGRGWQGGVRLRTAGETEIEISATISLSVLTQVGNEKDGWYGNQPYDDIFRWLIWKPALR
jgi:hypothetical protein